MLLSFYIIPNKSTLEDLFDDEKVETELIVKRIGESPPPITEVVEQDFMSDLVSLAKGMVVSHSPSLESESSWKFQRFKLILTQLGSCIR